MGGRCAVGAAVAVWSGLLLGPHLGLSAALCGLALVPPLAFVAVRAADRPGTLSLLLALLLAGACRGAAHISVLEAARRCPGAGAEMMRLEGRVIAPPERESGEAAVVIEVRAADPPLPCGTRVRLRLPAGTPVEWSDRLEALARLEVPLTLRNPGGYDARAAADAAGIAAVGRAFVARASPASGPAAWPRLSVARWRRAIDGHLGGGLDSATRELVVPLVVGDRSAVSPELNARLRASGLIHLLALSGLHVAWMVMIARGAAAAAGRGVRARAIAGALCALAYVGIAGPLPSLMRAAATELFHSAARTLSRALDPVQGLALSALALLLVAPGWAADLGFQLSCSAALGLVTIGPVLSGGERRCRALRAALAPTAGAQLTAMPLLLHRFHAVSWIAPLSNLAAVPISGLLLTAAWLGVLAESAAPGLGHPWFSACEALCAALRAVAEVSARAPAALLAAGPGRAAPLLAAGGAVLLALAAPPPRDLESRARPRSRSCVAAAGLGTLASALALVLAATTRPLRPPDGRAWLVALDVGQGDALALGLPDGWWLVDAGPHSPRYDAGESVVLPFLRWAGVRRLETLVLTHDDGDHTGGAPAIERGVAVGRVLAPLPDAAAAGPARRLEAATAGAVLHRSPDVRVLWPAPPGDGMGKADGAGVAGENTSSMVLEVEMAGTRLLLLADVDSTVESLLPLAEPVTLVKVAHHGSRRSSGMRFLERARPRFAVISCGRRNPFGHPDPGVLERLRAGGARICRTDSAGALWFEAGPEGLRFVDWRTGAPAEIAPGAGEPVPAPVAPAPRAP
jgi:competence protein ComEC